MKCAIFVDGGATCKRYYNVPPLPMIMDGVAICVETMHGSATDAGSETTTVCNEVSRTETSYLDQ
ncbi:MAG: hypothetical protein MJY71_08805 [Bacteroidaceae bacterium]|nr:hypothetical protein [Bacteroidaceae bacterium]